MSKLDINKSVIQSTNRDMGKSNSSDIDQTFSQDVTVDLSYHELSDRPFQQVDPLIQLQKNVEQICRMTSKLQFMMREIRYLLKVQ